jgi:multidrug efflux pump subunit AcrB
MEKKLIKKFITFAIEKSILNHIFFLFLFLLGSFAYINIPKEIFPPTNLDALSITGSYQGASPDILDKMAVSTIEDDLKNLSDIATLKSTIKSGFFQIKADLKEGANINDALSDTKDIITNLRRDLPNDMDEPVVKVIKNSFPLVTIAIASNEGTKAMLEVARTLKKELSSIDDLSDIQIRGEADEELLFALEDKKIEALGLSRESIIQALSSLSTIFPIGMIKERGNHLALSTYNGLKNIDEIKESIITIGEKKVRIKEIAEVSFVLSDATEISHFNALPNISVNINKSKTGNAITLVKEIKEILKRYEQKYTNYAFDVYTDSSIWIRNRLNTVISNILFGLILVTLSIYIFVNARISFVVGIGIPTSFLIGLIATELLGYSLNMLSLLGALIALGMLVDEAIVVAENIQRHLEEGDDPKTAAINGATEMFPAVLTATATTIFAFLPLLIMSGEMGVFIKVLPIMISVLLLSSLFEAFYFLPLHAKEFQRRELKVSNHTLWDRLKKYYSTLLHYLLSRRFIALGLFLLLVFSGTFWMLKKSKFQLFPDFDTTQIYVSGKVNKNFSLTETQALVTEVEKVLLEKFSDKDIASITSISGMKLDAKYKPEVGENLFHIFINLHERVPENFYNTYINPYLSPEYDDSDMLRERSAHEIAQQIKALTKKFYHDKSYEEFSVIVPGAGIVESDIDIAFSGSLNHVQSAISLLKEKMKTITGVYNISDDLVEGEKELKLKLNPYGASLGFSEASLANTLRPLFLKAEIAKMFYEGKLTRIKSQEINRDSLSTLENISISIPKRDKTVRLNEIATFIIQPSFASITKEDGQKVYSVLGSLNKEILTSSEFLKQIAPTLKKIEKSGVSIEIKGEEKENKKIQKEMIQAAIIAIFLIFIALIWMFDSISLSLFVLSTIPLSLFGVLIGHLIMSMNLTMPGMLGIVGLAGVVVNDGIIMIDFIRKATNYKEFIKNASLRLRPILLTSITTILGLSTLIFFAAGQSVILQPMAVSLGFGIAWATILNLFFLPLLYATVHKIKV